MQKNGISSNIGNSPDRIATCKEVLYEKLFSLRELSSKPMTLHPSPFSVLLFLFWEKRKVNSETLDEHNLTTRKNVTHLVACLPELLKNTESCMSRTKPSSITPIDGSKAFTFKACNYKVHC